LVIRGVDGSVILNCPEFAEALKTDGEILETEHLKRLGKASLSAFNRLKNEGVDIDGYTMIDVIDDIEDARKALGYDKINFNANSYGTRITYLFGVRYPQSVNRSFMELINTPGGFVWEPDVIDSQLEYLGELWKKDSNCVKRSPDIIKTVENVFNTLPYKWKKETIYATRVKMMMFNWMYTRDGIVQVFDAFVAAENGDYSGLAFLSMGYDILSEMGLIWGDSFSKAYSADIDPNRNYEKDMDPPGSIIGSPMSKLNGLMQYGGWPMKPIPEEYKKLHYSDVETLMLNGDIDFSTPVDNAKKLLPYLKNGHLVVLPNRGHQDIGGLQRSEFRKIVKEFYKTGNVDSSGFKDFPIDFSPPKQSLQKMGKLFYTIDRLHLTNLVIKLMM